MTREQVEQVMAALGVAPSPENYEKARMGLQQAMRGFLNQVWMMRQTQRRFAEGERSLVLVKQTYEKAVDEALAAMKAANERLVL